MTPLEKLRFEAYARNCGYNLNKEGDRYCHGVVNQMKDTWAAALNALPASSHGATSAPPQALSAAPH